MLDTILTPKLANHTFTTMASLRKRSGVRFATLRTRTGLVLDYDEQGNLFGIDIDNASNKLDLTEVVTSHIPLQASA